MPADFEACVNNGGRVRTMKMKDGKYAHVCFDKEGKSHIGEIKKKKESAPFHTEHLRWSSEIIVEKLDEKSDGSIKIKGTAIKARESRNGIVYEMAELSKAKETLKGKTIALNHSENAEDVVGIIDEVSETPDTLEYVGKAYNTGKHPYIIELLQKGLIRHVSIEATTPQIIEDKGRKMARNLEFLGLAFVRHPGIPEASATVAEAMEKIPEEDVEILESDIQESKLNTEPSKAAQADNPPCKGGEMAENEIKTEMKAEPDHRLESLQKDMAAMKEEVVLAKKASEEAKKTFEESMKPKETSKGIVTESVKEPGFAYVENFREKEGYPARSFAVKGRGSGKMEMFALHPDEWY